MENSFCFLYVYLCTKELNCTCAACTVDHRTIVVNTNGSVITAIAATPTTTNYYNKIKRNRNAKDKAWKREELIHLLQKSVLYVSIISCRTFNVFVSEHNDNRTPHKCSGKKMKNKKKNNNVCLLAWALHQIHTILLFDLVYGLRSPFSVALAQMKMATINIYIFFIHLCYFKYN